MGFTEEELTQMAILKAESLKKNLPEEQIPEKEQPIQPQPKKQKNIVNDVHSETKNNNKTVKPLEENIQEKYKYKVDLGNNKTVHYTNWTGKTKKVFNKLIETKGEDISVDDISETLIREYIQEQDIYLSPLEEQYLIVKIRDVSLSTKYTFVSECPNCSEVQEITDSTKNIFKFKKSKFPQKINGIEYVDIPSNSVFKKTVHEIQNSPTYDGLSTQADIEIAMHLKIDNKTPQEVMDYIDTLSLKEIEEILSNLSKISSDLKMGTEKTCKKCSQKGFFECDEIPNVFVELV